MKKIQFRKWELALCAALVITILFSAGLARDQRELSEKLIRLHVVANSDSPEDQSLKLKVRDRVLSELSAMLEGVSDRETARETINQNIGNLASAASETAADNGYGYSVTASLKSERFPTREYDSFTLPAGEYESLRIEIGDSGGANWWCVVFPPLCSDSPASAKEALAELDDDEITLITEDSEGFAVKFRVLELISELYGFFTEGDSEAPES